MEINMYTGYGHLETYGAATITRGDDSHQHSVNELEGACVLGRHLAEITTKLAA
jgi:hypothetical protein